ncbi:MULTISPECIES: hypothetical protein [unclassified Psychrobacter]|uniref:hypothetical protein n=1 Tax=unclassified Psychrobacter TaxID=196806 RepID=UPI00071E8515|nr:MULTISPECIES: hypothetical protein [unclassified Psychrobacter]OLF37485.1 hypothetical protein BTV98_07655 [Psychrobacter sp. Cmf 22.2]
MSTKSKDSTANDLSVNQQQQQARMLLLRLQWLFILLLVIALAWLYITQQRFQNQINERLQSNEHMVSRLNEMDDRLFAISQRTLPEPSKTPNSQAQNQLDLLRIQIQAVDRLIADNNYKGSIDLLQGLLWQLSQDSNEISPALTIVIKQSLTKDIERLQAQSSQPSPWQLQTLAIQNVQEFLHRYVRTSSQKNSVALTRQQLAGHEVIMVLNLAIQASNMREQDQLIEYLNQAQAQLQTLVKDTSSSSQTKPSTSSQLSFMDNKPTTEQQKTPMTMESPEDIVEAIAWLDKLIANTPKPTHLLTTQMLDKPEHK